jgi:hypothetical protein
MAHWEFLIQQEGDRSWLPLDAPDVEILEGRYRVVARSSQTSAPVDIRIIHEALYETPPRRRAQNRSAQTNSDGLVMVIPFTQLQPGTWELRCTSDVMSDMLGDGWQANVSLQVLPHEAQATDDWDTDWTPGVDEPTESTVTSNSSEPPPTAMGEPSEPSQQQAIANAAMDQIAAESEPDFDQSFTANAPIAAPPIADPATQSATSGHASPESPDTDTVSFDAIAAEPEPHAAAEEPPPSHTANLGEYVQAVDDLIDSVFQQLDESLSDGTAAPPDTASLPDPVEAVEAAEAIAPQPDASSDEPRLSAPEERLESDASTAAPVEPFPSAPDPTAAIAASDEGATVPSEPPTPAPQREPELAVSAEASPSESALPALPLALRLDTDTYTVQRDGVLTLSGAIEWAEAIAPDALSGWATHYQVRIRLVDPQTGRSRQEQVEPLSAIDPPQLPIPFRYELSPNLDQNTHLLLGDLELFCTDREHPDGTAIAVQSFTVTVDVTDLLSAIAQESEESKLFQAPLDFQDAKPAPAPDLTFLNFLSSPPSSMGMNVSAARTPAPQSQDPPPSNASPDGIDLPSFSTRPPASQPAATESTQWFVDPSSGAVSPIETHTAEPMAENTAATANEGDAFAADPLDATRADDGANTPDASNVTQSGAIADLSPTATSEAISTSLPIDPLDSSQIELPPPVIAEDEDFQSLKLGDRFLTRLSSLANDQELTHWLSAVAPPPQSAQDATDDDLYGITSPWQTAPSGWDADIASNEIVVDDNRGRSGNYSSTPTGRSMAPVPAADPPSTLCIPGDQPIPTPILDIPASDLTAGQPTHLRVLLPKVESKIYVKVWIHDCQQRMVVDGPHWVSNFLPNSQDQLEGSLLLTVPLGCMEARIEAIAIEILTQRESRKVSINRFVMPPNLPDLAFDELDV